METFKAKRLFCDFYDRKFPHCKKNVMYSIFQKQTFDNLLEISYLFLSAFFTNFHKSQQQVIPLQRVYDSR